MNPQTKFRTTRVQFLIHEENISMLGTPGDLFAYFPTEVADNNGNRLAYSHIGQHSACHPGYAQESRKATPEEYNELRAELESIGYSLTII